MMGYYRKRGLLNLKMNNAYSLILELFLRTIGLMDSGNAWRQHIPWRNPCLR